MDIWLWGDCACGSPQSVYNTSILVLSMACVCCLVDGAFRCCLCLQFALSSTRLPPLHVLLSSASNPPHFSSSPPFPTYNAQPAAASAASTPASKEAAATAVAAEEGAPSFVIDTQPTTAAPAAPTTTTITTTPTTAEKEKEKGNGKEVAVKEKEKESEGKDGQHHASSRWSSAPSEGGGPPTKKRGSIGRKEERRRQLALLAREEEEEATEELYTVTILVPNEAMGLLIGRCKDDGGREGEAGYVLLFRWGLRACVPCV